MKSNQQTYEELAFRLAQAEEILSVIRTTQTAALVGDRKSLLARIQETGKALQKAYHALRQRHPLTDVTASHTLLHSETAKREQVEAHLQKNKVLFHALLDNSPTIAYIEDEHGRCLYASKLFAPLHSLPLFDVLDKTDHDLWPEEIAQQMRAYDAAVLAADAPCDCEAITQREESVRRWLSYKFPLPRVNGSRVLAGVSVDMSKHKRAEEALHLMSKVFQDAADPILIKDLSGRILDANAEVERVYGWTRAELLGQSVSILSPPERRTQTEKLTARCQGGETIRNIEGVCWNKAGQRFPVLLTLSLLTDSLGRPQAIATIAKDISALKQAGTALRKKNSLAAIGATVAKVSHEIANPLNGIYSTVQLLERHIADQYKQTDTVLLSTVQDLKSETNRLQSLLNELRALRPVTLQIQPLSLTALATDLLATETHYYRECGIRIAQDFPAGLPTIMADRERLKQALLNLCKNAVEAMPEGGVLTLRSQAAGEKVFLYIQDTGRGIPEGIDIFESFVSTKSTGTGLGLAIVRQIVEAHGGEITYHSELGVGTTFTMALPIMA